MNSIRGDPAPWCKIRIESRVSISGRLAGSAGCFVRFHANTRRQEDAKKKKAMLVPSRVVDRREAKTVNVRNAIPAVQGYERSWWQYFTSMLSKLLFTVLIGMTVLEFCANLYIAITGYLVPHIPMLYVNLLTLVVWSSWIIYKWKRRRSLARSCGNE